MTLAQQSPLGLTNKEFCNAATGLTITAPHSPVLPDKEKIDEDSA